MEELSRASEIRADYERRYDERRALEAQWKLNASFVSGKQNLRATASGSLIEEDKRRLWEERAVYNHTASILETRLARLGKVRPKLSVAPFSGKESAVSEAKLATAVLNNACEKMNLSEKIGEATMWSELTGTAFYKVSWDKTLGKKVGESEGKPVFEGDVRVDVCPPYEIFPDSVYCADLDKCQSVIHAKALPVMALDRAIRCGNDNSESVYDSRGILFI